MARESKTDGKAKLIAVTGPTGAGKTTFINAVCGSHLRVGTSLQSCTDKVQTAYCNINGENITLIDTPGFDDTYKSQADILKDIADFLEQTYERGRKLSGVIYMHRISDYRVGGIARENFRLFSKICGEGAMKNVVIVTTMWEDVAEEVGAQRETELRSKPLFFKDAVDHGARMQRLLNTPQSALDTMSPFFEYAPKVLHMQYELVDLRKLLPHTDAGTELKTELERQAERHKQELQQLQVEMSETAARKDAAHREEMEDLRTAFAEMQKKMEKLDKEMQKLTNSTQTPRERPQSRGFREILRKASHSLFRGRVDNREAAVFVRERGGAGCLSGDNLEI